MEGGAGETGREHREQRKKISEGSEGFPLFPNPPPKGLGKCIQDNPKITAKAASQEAAQQEAPVGQALEHWSIQSLGDQLGERGPYPAWWVIGRSWGVLLGDGKTLLFVKCSLLPS